MAPGWEQIGSDAAGNHEGHCRPGNTMKMVCSWPACRSTGAAKGDTSLPIHVATRARPRQSPRGRKRLWLTGSALPQRLPGVVVPPQSRGAYAVQGCPSVICALPDPSLVLRRPAPRTLPVLRSPRHLGLVVPSAPGCREGTCGGIHGCIARRALGGGVLCAGGPGGGSGWVAPSDVFCGGSGFLSGVGWGPQADWVSLLL